MAAVLAAAVALAGCSAPQTLSGAASGSTVNSAPGGVPQEGIKVHGHWTIEVTNPDGTLAERREFENALTSSGASTMARFMGRRNSVGGWVVYLWTTTGTAPFMDTQGNNNMALILEPSYALSDAVYFKNLVVDVPTTGVNANKLVLSGNATAQRDGVINRVITAVNQLDATLPPSGAYVSSWQFFTQSDLATAVTVSGGQQIAVTVVISFS